MRQPMRRRRIHRLWRTTASTANAPAQWIFRLGWRRVLFLPYFAVTLVTLAVALATRYCERKERRSFTADRVATRGSPLSLCSSKINWFCFTSMPGAPQVQYQLGAGSGCICLPQIIRTSQVSPPAVKTTAANNCSGTSLEVVIGGGKCGE